MAKSPLPKSDARANTLAHLKSVITRGGSSRGMTTLARDADINPAKLDNFVTRKGPLTDDELFRLVPHAITDMRYDQHTETIRPDPNYSRPLSYQERESAKLAVAREKAKTAITAVASHSPEEDAITLLSKVDRSGGDIAFARIEATRFIANHGRLTPMLHNRLAHQFGVSFVGSLLSLKSEALKALRVVSSQTRL